MLGDVEAGGASGGKSAGQDFSKYFSSLLDDEVSGVLERGLTAPKVRIPGKTHLSAVLLIANPWEQRDLDRKLSKIKKERIQKERNLEWNQRQFFINQIFDQDLNLRFNKLLVEDKMKKKQAEQQYQQGRKARAVRKKAERKMMYGMLQPKTPDNKLISQEPEYHRKESCQQGDASVQPTARCSTRASSTAFKPQRLNPEDADSATGRTEKQLNASKRLSVASMGIFAPPLNLKQKAKHQKSRLLQKQNESEQLTTDRELTPPELRSQSQNDIDQEESKDVAINGSNENAEETAEKSPVVDGNSDKVATLDNSKETVVEDADETESDVTKTEIVIVEEDGSEKSSNGDSGVETEGDVNSSKSEDSDKSSESKTQDNSRPETAEAEETSSPELRVEGNVTNVVYSEEPPLVEVNGSWLKLPDIRINNYTVSSPVQDFEDDIFYIPADAMSEAASDKLTIPEEETPGNETDMPYIGSPVPSKTSALDVFDAEPSGYETLSATPSMFETSPVPPHHSRWSRFGAVYRAGMGFSRPVPRIKIGEDSPTQTPTERKTRLTSREDTRLSTGYAFRENNFPSRSEQSPSEMNFRFDDDALLLDADVITRLTRTLPQTLMVRANQNTNRIIDNHKQRMLRKARTSSSRNTMADPRWENLTSSLFPNFIHE